jgi:hypothetical protein
MFLAARARRSSTKQWCVRQGSSVGRRRFFAPAGEADELGAPFVRQQSDLGISVSAQIDELEVRSGWRVSGGFQVEVFCIFEARTAWPPGSRAAVSTLLSTVLDSTALSGQRHLVAPFTFEFLQRLTLDRIKRSSVAAPLDVAAHLHGRINPVGRFWPRRLRASAIIYLSLQPLVLGVGLSPSAGALIARKRGRRRFAAWRRAGAWNRRDKSGGSHAPADEETSCFQFGQFVLNGLERKAA